MNRPIKFRAESVGEGYGQWVYGYVFKTPLTIENFGAGSFDSPIGRWCIATEQGVVYEIDIKTLGQFTGLLDKNGKEIYEEDIVRYDNGLGNSTLELIKWSHHGACWVKGDGNWDDDGFTEWRTKEVEIIGNVMENPELLKR